MESVTSPPRTTRQKWAVALFAAQLLAALAAWIAAAVEVESIVVTGPLLAVVGLALAVVIQPIQTWMTLWFALSAPLVSALMAFVVGLFELSPREAALPVVAIQSLYLLILTVPAVAVFRQIRRWRLRPLLKQPWVWRYSMKSMLAVMTLVAIITAALASVVDAITDYVIFEVFGATSISICAVVTWHFYSSRRTQHINPCSPQVFERGGWLRNVVYNVFASSPHQVHCSFCGRAYQEAGPFAEGRDGSLICGSCAARCGELIVEERAHSSAGAEKV